MPANIPNIILKVISYSENGGYLAICLDTDIMVHGESLYEVRNKMIDAIKLYMRSFSDEEIAQRKYIRRAPARYYLKLFQFAILLTFRHLRGSINTAEYNPLDHNLQLA